jgi:lysophospholipase L1-like esterase
MTTSPMRILILVLLAGCVAAAQSATEAGPTVAMLEQRLAAYRHLLADWASLTRYGSDNSEVRPPAAGEQRVVFFGDQITESWRLAEFFPGKPYFNRGITGQTSPQMLVRFRQDVIGLRPKVVVILAGTNDIARFTGPATKGTLADHIMSMIDLAKANGIRVVLGSITPICDCTKLQTDLRPQGRIADWNGWLREHAAQSGSVYVDYYSALASGRNLKPELTVDGLLPNDAGYKVMTALAEQAIAQALAAPAARARREAAERERVGVPASSGRGHRGRPATARSRRSAHGTLARGGGGPHAH